MISIIIPVYKGGEIFLNAVQSLEDYASGISGVFISFNALDDDCEDIIKFKYWLNEGGEKNHEYFINITRCELSSKDHALAVFKWYESIGKTEYIMTLCHDDRLSAVFDFSSYALEPKTIIFPVWRTVDCNYQYLNEEKIEEMSPDKMIFANNWSHYMNISGIIYHKRFWDRLRWIYRLKKGGQRTEMTVCTQPEVQKLVVGSHYVEIMVRDDSDGAKISSKQFGHDELIYIITLIYFRRYKALLSRPKETLERIKIAWRAYRS